MIVCLDLALSENGVPQNPSLYHHVPIRTTIWVYLVGPIVGQIGQSQMSYCLSVVYPILAFVNYTTSFIIPEMAIFINQP